jgi:hypothetical protein
MADPNQTPARGDWLCPCSGCQKSVKEERRQLVEMIENHKLAYLEYISTSFDEEDSILLSEDSKLTYVEACDKIISKIADRNPKPRTK